MNYQTIRCEILEIGAGISHLLKAAYGLSQVACKPPPKCLFSYSARLNLNLYFHCLKPTKLNFKYITIHILSVSHQTILQ